MEFIGLLNEYITCLKAPPLDGVSKCLLSGWSLGDIATLVGVIAAVIAGIVKFHKAIFSGLRNIANWIKRRNVVAIISSKIETENPGIVGREKDCDALLKLFEAGNSVVAIHAQGGVGKTALADEYARRQAASGRYGGVWRIAATSASDAANDIRPLAIKLGVEDSNKPDVLIPAALDAMVATSKKWLLIHDNVDEEEMQRGLINRLLHKDMIDHLITGRMGNWNNDVKPYPLEELSNKEAVKLLARDSGRKSSAKLKRLAIDTLGRLPLALVVAGADLRLMDKISVVQYSKGFEERLKEAPAGRAYEKSVYAAVTGSLELLDENAKALLKLAAYMDPEDIDEGFLFIGAALAEKRGYQPLLEPLNTLAKNDIARADAFAKCKAHSLLKPAKWEGEDTFRIHRLTQMVLRDWMGNEAADYIGYVARLGREQFTSSPQYAVEDWPRYRRLAPHARAMASEAKQAKGDDLKLASDFVHDTALFLEHSSGDLPSVRSIYFENLGITELAYGRESEDYSTALASLGHVQGYFDEDEAAENNLKKALEISIRMTDKNDPERATLHNLLAFFYNARKRYVEAEPEFELALQIYEKAFDGKGELVATAHGNIGSNYSEWSGLIDDEATIASYREMAMVHKVKSLDFTREALGEVHFDTGACLNNLAYEYSKTGDADKGLPLQIRAAAIPLAMHQQGLIGREHPHIQRGIGSLVNLLKFLEPPLDDKAVMKKATELAMAEIPEVIKAHQEWKDAQDDGGDDDASAESE